MESAVLWLPPAPPPIPNAGHDTALSVRPPAQKRSLERTSAAFPAFTDRPGECPGPGHLGASDNVQVCTDLPRHPLFLSPLPVPSTATPRPGCEARWAPGQLPTAAAPRAARSSGGQGCTPAYPSPPPHARRRRRGLRSVPQRGPGPTPRRRAPAQGSPRPRPAGTHLSQPLLVLLGPARLLPHAAILETLGSQMSPPRGAGPAPGAAGKRSPGGRAANTPAPRADCESHKAVRAARARRARPHGRWSPPGAGAAPPPLQGEGGGSGDGLRLP